jgi:hypothetical protein
MTDPDRFIVIPDEVFDLAATGRLHEHFALARARRLHAWFADFRRAAWTATVVVATPSVFAAPDDLPDLRLVLPAPNPILAEIAARSDGVDVARSRGGYALHHRRTGAQSLG